MNILFTCAGRRNYLINYFKEALNGCEMYYSRYKKTAPTMVDADMSLSFLEYDINYIESIEI